MTKWISELLSREGIRGKPMELPWILRMTEDNVRMNLLEYPLPCGHSAFRVDLEFHVEAGDRWIAIAALGEFTLAPTIQLLRQAQKCIENLRA